jgi:hypothetical protein
MGTIEKGYMGGFKGILGTAVGSKWKGKSVIKAASCKKDNTVNGVAIATTGKV